MKKAAVDLLLLAQREKYLSLLRQVLPALELACDELGTQSRLYPYEVTKSALQAVREALK
jgi:hypothetical protein